MVNLMKLTMAAAAVLAFNGAVAYGQAPMKLDVPFTFQTPNATMQPGTYELTYVPTGTSTHLYTLRHLESGKKVVMAASDKVERRESKNLRPEVTFTCAGELCMLRAIYQPHTTVGHAVPTLWKAERASGREIAEVRIPAAR